MATLANVQVNDIVVMHKADGSTRRLHVVSATKATIKTRAAVWSKATGRKRGADPRWEPEWIEAEPRTAEQLHLGGGITLPILDTMSRQEAFESGMTRLERGTYSVAGLQVQGVCALNDIWVERNDGSFVLVGRR